MFDSTKEDLKDILRWAEEGRLQLPEFQRDYVWGDNDVRSLIEPRHLRNDDFDAFFEARMAALANVVARALEKPVVDEHGANEDEKDVDGIEDQDALEDMETV